MFRKPNIYFIALFALGTGLFQSAFDLTYLHIFATRAGNAMADFDWVWCNLAQMFGTVAMGVALWRAPRVALSPITFAWITAAAIFFLGFSSFTTTPIAAFWSGSGLLFSVGLMTGFLLGTVARYGQRSSFGLVASIGMAVGIVLEFVTVQVAGAGAPSLASWLGTAILALTMLGVVVMHSRRWLPLPTTDETGASTPDASALDEGDRPRCSLPNASLLGLTAALMMTVSLMGIFRPRLVTPDLIDRLAFMQAFIIVGIVLVGVVVDRSRRGGAQITLATLSLSFLGVAVMGILSTRADLVGPISYSVGYTMLGSTITFSIIAFMDLGATYKKMLPFAVGGMAIHSLVEAAVMAIPDSAIANSFSSALLLVSLFAPLLLVALATINRLYPMAGIAAQAQVPEQELLSTNPRSLDDAVRVFAARYDLSMRERSVLREVLDGRTNSEMASRLYISENTVKFHVKNILRKSGCENRTDVVDLAWHPAE